MTFDEVVRRGYRPGCGCAYCRATEAELRAHNVLGPGPIGNILTVPPPRPVLEQIAPIPVVLPDEAIVDPPPEEEPVTTIVSRKGLALTPATEALIAASAGIGRGLLRDATPEEAELDKSMSGSGMQGMGGGDEFFIGRLIVENGRFYGILASSPDKIAEPISRGLLCAQSGQIFVPGVGVFRHAQESFQGPGSFLPWQCVVDGYRRPFMSVAEIEEFASLFDNKSLQLGASTPFVWAWPILSVMRKLYADDGYHKTLARFNAMLAGSDVEVVAMVGACVTQGLSSFDNVSYGRDARYTYQHGSTVAYRKPAWAVWLRYEGHYDLNGIVWIDEDGVFLMSAWCQRESSTEGSGQLGREEYHGTSMQHTILTWALGPGSQKLSETNRAAGQRFKMRALPNNAAIPPSPIVSLAQELLMLDVREDWIIRLRTKGEKFLSDELCFHFLPGYPLPSERLVALGLPEWARGGRWTTSLQIRHPDGRILDFHGMVESGKRSRSLKITDDLAFITHSQFRLANLNARTNTALAMPAICAITSPTLMSLFAEAYDTLSREWLPYPIPSQAD